MTAEENELARAVREFNAAVDSLKRPGVSWIAELAQLKILVTKYPDHARQLLGEQPPATASVHPDRVGDTLLR
jgi:hypothetical protein